MHRRSPRVLASSWLRALTLSSFAVGGLFVAAPAHSAETSEAPATILDVSMQDGELTARIRWAAESKSLPSEVEVVSYDGTDKLTAGERLSPKPGEEVEVKLYGAVQEPWETGWAQQLVVREPKGRELTRQPYDVSLDCEDEKTCALKATPGVAASREVVHVSEALERTLASIEKELGGKEFNLVHEVARREPSLYGEALSYAQSRVVYGPAEGCRCTWQASFTRTNGQGTTTSLGAAHDLYARPLSMTRPQNARLTAQGTSRVTLTLSCTSLASILFQNVGIKQSGGLVKPVLMPQPVYSTCAGTCSGRFSHFGRITGSAWANSTSSPLLNATSMEQSKYHLGNGLSPLLNETRYAPLNSSFDVDATVSNSISGSGYVQTSAEAFYTYNGNSLMWQPWGRARGGYAIAVQGIAVCPGGGLNPMGRAWDIATGEDNQSSLSESVWNFLGL
ncbi:hypothetical protein COCOR_07678 [Corallococcus coralloides DSM 2259]|uniref:Lipoprotein n=1 Tax=Corallococcus coralloides (strain ATCC 25202 / DSM 2259 / NBRC 100086 / M2) TaxID=1144275 RepID=H8MRU7_CORCM|nr:hypothetical protein [Corallococcus coralloides]AFE07673.1 hypothetical protein COCOR_07678 [Corallococcus coralloides DSM 2259]